MFLDYKKSCKILANKFKEKGYKEELIKDASTKYLSKYGEPTPQKPDKSSRDFSTKCITNYNDQHWQI